MVQSAYINFLGNVSTQWQYDCAHQGVSVGWMDIYDEHITCQYVDITDFEAGIYTLKTILNPNNVVAELDTSNNEANATFEYNGDLTSYYWSTYRPCKSDMKTWTRAMNSMLVLCMALDIGLPELNGQWRPNGHGVANLIKVIQL